MYKKIKAMSKRASASKSQRLAAIKKTVAAEKDIDMYEKDGKLVPVTLENHRYAFMAGDLLERGFTSDQAEEFIKEQKMMDAEDCDKIQEIDDKSSSDEESKSDDSEGSNDSDTESISSSSSEEIKKKPKKVTKYTKEKFFECVPGPKGTIKKLEIPPLKKFRAFVFTWNNYPEDWKQKLADIEARYLVCGEEEAPTTGTPHIQGYCEFKQQLRISEFAKKVWQHTGATPGDRKTGISYFAPARADADKNKTYVTKEGEPYEYGESSRKGKRNDIVKIKEIVKKGCSMKDILEVSTSYQSAKMGQLLLNYYEAPRNPQTDNMTVIWIYGNSGAGKSYDAKGNYPNAYVKGNNMSKWYQDYDGQKEVILEEFRNSTMTFSELLGLLQPYEFRVETKGGSRQMKATTIVINTCYSPTEIYPSISENRDQLYRRITELHFYKSRKERSTMVMKEDEDIKKRCQKIRKFCETYLVHHEEEEIDSDIDISDDVKTIKIGEKTKKKSHK